MPIVQSLPIAVGSDHAGYNMKTEVLAWLKGLDHPFNDFGVDHPASVDYPDYAHPVASAVEQGKASFGILICGTGNGVCMTANKHAGIRAGLCWTPEVASLIRKHNDANVICLPARFIDTAMAKEMIAIFIDTAFEGGRHQARINKMTC